MKPLHRRRTPPQVRKPTVRAESADLLQPERAYLNWLFPVLLACLTFLCFLPALQNEFVSWDDEMMLVHNRRYRGLGWAQIRWMFSTFHLGHYQPLSWVTFALDYLIWGLNPFGYHLTNLLFHTINAVLFYRLSLHLLSLTSPESERLVLRIGAFFSALLFAIHPLRVESVAWATERRDVLSGLLILLTVLSYLHAVAAENGRYGRRLSYTLALYVLSLLAKASGMTLPLVLVLLDVYPLRRLGDGAGRWFGPKSRKAWREKIPFFLLAFLFGAVALLAQKEAGALRGVEGYYPAYRLAQAFFGIVFYLWKTLIPLKLSPLYEAPFYIDVMGGVFVLCAVIVIGLTIFFWRLRSSWPAGWVAWLCYLLLLAPVLGVAQSGPQLVADRYSYLSCLSWAGLAGAGLVGCRRAWKGATNGFCYVAAAIAGICLITLGSLTWQQVQVWHDSERLWRHVLLVVPHSSFAHNNLGTVFFKRGQLDEAVERFHYALQINPRFAAAHYGLANVLYRRGQLDQAIHSYRNALEIRPGFMEAHYNLGVALAKSGSLNESIQHYQTALRLQSDNAEVHNNLGNALLTRGEINEAMEHYREALRIEPGLLAARQNLSQLEMITNPK